MTSKLKLKVNGSTQDVNVEANTMLLYVLRDAMELHRPKFGCSLVISPDGLHNQIEGNIIQSLSRTRHEEITFDHSRVTSLEWTAYPILRFSEIPDDIEMALVNNEPEHKSTGGGEPSTNPHRPLSSATLSLTHTGARLRQTHSPPSASRLN